jgi:crossover junction endodeoxyribonuclease RuvC
MRVLGVDPGATGALALWDTSLDALIVCDMPAPRVRVGKAVRRQISEAWLAATLAQYEPDCAWIERVHALPKQGVTSSFNFGLAYGLIRGVLAGFRVPVQLVTPQEWKRHFRLGPDKTEARLIASRLFPANALDFTRIKDDGRAEAALLALFGAQQQKDVVSRALCLDIAPDRATN